MKISDSEMIDFVSLQSKKIAVLTNDTDSLLRLYRVIQQRQKAIVDRMRVLQEKGLLRGTFTWTQRGNNPDKKYCMFLNHGEEGKRRSYIGVRGVCEPKIASMTVLIERAREFDQLHVQLRVFEKDLKAFQECFKVLRRLSETTVLGK